jgi:two-component system, NtrC family, nitrogen regulation response regulator NtrX
MNPRSSCLCARRPVTRHGVVESLFHALDMDAAESGTVLVVEDDASLQRALGGLLKRQGFSPVTATTVSSAIQATGQHSLDAVILDLLLDGNESGVDYLAWLREQPRYQRTPVLIYTGRTMVESDAEELIRRYRAHVFYKPHPATLLVEYLRQLTAASSDKR